MQRLDIGGYTRQQVIDALHAVRGARNVKYRYDLLDKTEKKIGELDCVEGCEISMAAFTGIKRSARFRIKDNAKINRPTKALKLTSQYTSGTSSNRYTYITFNDVDYLIEEGDILIYEIFTDFNNESHNMALDADFVEGGSLRSYACNDQNGIAIAAHTNLEAYTKDKWYERIFSSFGSAYKGKTVNRWLLADEGDGTGTNIAYFRNIRIESPLGKIKYLIWQAGMAYLSINAYSSNRSGAIVEDIAPIQDITGIDWLSDRIQPFFMLKMPNGWLEWPLGIFLLSTPTKQAQNGEIYRDVEAYDGLLVLRDDKVENRYSIAAGTNYYTAIVDLLTSSGITKYNIEQTDKELPTALEWDIGTPKLQIVNKLLSELNYTPLWADEYGYYTARSYISPQDRAPEYDYTTDKKSVIAPGAQETEDLFSVPNKWVVVASNPESLPLIATYTNSNPDSPTSTVNRGRVITDFRQIDNIADQASLNAYVERLAFEASQVFNYRTFATWNMPMHSYNDVYNLTIAELGTISKEVETGWTMQLVPGAVMTHEVRRVVNI